MQEYTFETPEPIRLSVEIGAGQVRLRAEETATTYVTVEGQPEDDVTVTQSGRQITITAPRRDRGADGRSAAYDVQVSFPNASDVITKTGSADVTASGELAEAKCTSGSGDVEGEAFDGHVVVTTGSGDVHLERVGGETRIKSGSGTVQVDQCGADCGVSTGSGDVHLGRLAAAAQVKTGSGALAISEAGPDTTFKTGSGDVFVGVVRRGAVNVKGASGDIAIRVPDGTPTWADVSTLSGTFQNDLPSAGAPEEGQPYVELRLTTVSGDIRLLPADASQ